MTYTTDSHEVQFQDLEFCIGKHFYSAEGVLAFDWLSDSLSDDPMDSGIDESSVWVSATITEIFDGGEEGEVRKLKGEEAVDFIGWDALHDLCVEHMHDNGDWQ